MNIVKIQEDAININEAIFSIKSEECGGTSIFIGTSRDKFEDKKIIHLHYEIFYDMAYKEISNICINTKALWPQVKNIIVIHRIGVVPVGESSILVASNSPSRFHSIEATNYIINEIKKTVPIWKKEVFEQIENWKQNSDCDWIK